MLLPPSEDAALTIATAHQAFHFLAIQTPRPRSIGRAVTGFEVNPILVQQVEALLFVICRRTRRTCQFGEELSKDRVY